MEINNERYIGDVGVYNEPLFHDDRGTFIPTKMDHHNIQTNISINVKAHTFRGMHLQIGEFAQSKRLKVLSGNIIDFYVNLIPSKDYGRVGFLRMGPGDVIVVPRGYAHGFLTMCDNVYVQYLVDNEYNQEADRSINYKSFPLIQQLITNVGCTHEIQISSKDGNAPILDQFKSGKKRNQNKPEDIFGFKMYESTSRT